LNPAYFFHQLPLIVRSIPHYLVPYCLVPLFNPALSGRLELVFSMNHLSSQRHPPPRDVFRPLPGRRFRTFSFSLCVRLCPTPRFPLEMELLLHISSRVFCRFSRVRMTHPTLAVSPTPHTSFFSTSPHRLICMLIFCERSAGTITALLLDPAPSRRRFLWVKQSILVPDVSGPTLSTINSPFFTLKKDPINLARYCVETFSSSFFSVE